MTSIAIIPARGGSKRIPQKNIRPFLGKPILAYAIEAARAAGMFSAIVVSTDDTNTAAIARELGADVPFLRSTALSTDDVGTDAVILDAVERCQAHYGSFEYGCCIYPANPLLSASVLEAGFALLEKHGATSAFPVVRYDFPIDQALVFHGPHPVPRWPQAMQKNSQDLPEHFHDAGSFYWFDVPSFMHAGTLIGPDAVAFPVAAGSCQDINTLEDWTQAELKYRILMGESR